MPPIQLDTPLQYVKGVGPRKAEALAEKGFRTAEDLLFHLPFRYEDRTRFATIAGARPGQRLTLSGRILSSVLRRTRRRGFTLFEAVIGDDTGAIKAIWYNQPYLRDLLKAEREVVLYGEVALSRYGARSLQIDNPQYELITRDGTEGIHTGRIVPVYQRLGDLTPRMIRTILHNLLAALPAEVPDPLPPSLTAGRGLMPRGEALRAVHFPDSSASGADLAACQARTSPAHRRLIFEEFFLLQVALGLRREGASRGTRSAPYSRSPEIRERLKAVLPFRLTPAQRRVVKEILDDLMAPAPMSRLLQGDVGSGKTIVALLAMLFAVENGRQAALMAPTEILAEQHARVLEGLLAEAGERYRPYLLTGTLTAAERRPVLRAIEGGYARIIVGTHALIQEKVRYDNLGLVVIDEQHRFGVAQRAALRGKGHAGSTPDILVMTATPIPRSLALTLYGDLDLSVIDELPPGRRPIQTHVRGESGRARIYDFVRAQVAEGRQAYIVLPLVEETEKSDLRAAVAMERDLSRTHLQGLRLGLVHGRLKPAEREEAMRRFGAGEIDVLVATTVIEVGIDVPNATLMIVEHADRFGLSQLHQLRGRVGRGAHASHCILVHGDAVTGEARQRLEVLASSSDGFRIAEKDLELRGPGEFLGTRQSGLPEIRIGNIIRDFELLEEARREAAALLEDLRAKRGGQGEHEPLLAHMRRMWGERIGLMDVG